eukprot:SAG11_NODE_28790_length_317_cov_37.844037_1_plen_45_part_10
MGSLTGRPILPLESWPPVPRRQVAYLMLYDILYGHEIITTGKLHP